MATKNSFFPKKTTISIKLDKLLEIKEKVFISDKMSTRLVKSASVLDEGEFIGWQINIPTKGLAGVYLFGSKTLGKSDLEWIAEKAGKATKRTTNKTNEIINDSYTRLYEICLPVSEGLSSSSTIGFTGNNEPVSDSQNDQWPEYYSYQFDEIVTVMREIGGILRIILGSASSEEQTVCRKIVYRSFCIGGVSVNEYIGKPVKMRVLICLASAPSIRLRTIIEEAIPGAQIKYLGNLSEAKASNNWNNPLEKPMILPDYAARIMTLEPEVNQPIIGLKTCEEEVKPIPASHENVRDKNAVVIGKATDTTGIRHNIVIGETDLKRHYQIVGQTGTGKSTLLATIIISAIEKGHGLTFFDPHGSTIDTVLRAIPEKYIDKVRVVRVGDASNPVPFNIWDSDDPVKEERNISDLCELFGDLFDPRKEMIVGPRYERWLSTFAKASIAFLGRRASLESIAVISQSKENINKIHQALLHKYPELSETIKQEYGKDISSDFHATLNWYLCKFQRLTSVEQLRKTLGGGTNALDFKHTIDTDKVTLIDLASPTIGSHAARIIGTLMLMKLWSAAMERQKRYKTHLVLVDEASLFQTNPMPRMLAESRKFGISMVLCHQHTGQMVPEIRDALEANSANFSAFRLSPKDAETAAVRLDNPEMKVLLTRLNAYNAITTLSVDGVQSAPFTLETFQVKQLKNGEKIAAKIEARSRELLVEPYRKLGALTPEQINNYLTLASKEPRWIDNYINSRGQYY